ncbi:MAG TPA: hypothetical protein VFZ46_03340 [Nitrososphaeraceae archaeon]
MCLSWYFLLESSFVYQGINVNVMVVCISLSLTMISLTKGLHITVRATTNGDNSSTIFPVS